MPCSSCSRAAPAASCTTCTRTPSNVRASTARSSCSGKPVCCTPPVPKGKVFGTRVKAVSRVKSKSADGCSNITTFQFQSVPILTHVTGEKCRSKYCKKSACGGATCNTKCVGCTLTGCSTPKGTMSGWSKCTSCH